MRLPLNALLIATALLAATPAAAVATPVLDSLAPAEVTIGRSTVASGTVDPAVAGEQVQVQQLVAGVWTSVGTAATTDAAGAWRTSFKPRSGGRVRALQVSDGTTSTPPLRVDVVPRIFPGKVARGTIYPFLNARVRWRVAPATYPNGPVRIRLTIDGRSAGIVRARVRNGVIVANVPTRGVGRFRAQVLLSPRGGLERASGGMVAFNVRGERVASGSNATWNRSLRAALRFRGFHVPGGTKFDSRLGESVIAFHKAYGRPRTTGFEASDWKRLTRTRVAVRDRSRGLHIEIDKSRQILMQVRDGKATMIIHVSTGSTGNTPAGRHSILWKGDWVPSLYGSLLYKSMAFRGAFAIHGYPSVPTSPASHGCVRVPMWIASTLYARSPVGTPVIVYEGPGTTAPSLGRATAEADVPELTGVDVARWADEGPAATA